MSFSRYRAPSRSSHRDRLSLASSEHSARTALFLPLLRDRPFAYAPHLHTLLRTGCFIHYRRKLLPTRMSGRANGIFSCESKLRDHDEKRQSENSQLIRIECKLSTLMKRSITSSNGHYHTFAIYNDRKLRIAGNSKLFKKLMLSASRCLAIRKKSENVS